MPQKPFVWNFGRFYGTAPEVLKHLSLFLPHSKIIKSDYPNFEIRFRPTRSFPVLSLSLVFFELEPLNISDTMSEIVWDDSDEEFDER